MFLSTNREVVRYFCTNYAEFQSFVLSVELANGVKLEDRQHSIIDLAAAAFVHHERFAHARL